MKWDAVAALIAGIVALGAYLTWFVKAVIRQQNDELLNRINGTYVRSANSTLTGAEIGRHLEQIDRRLSYVERRIDAD